MQDRSSLSPSHEELSNCIGLVYDAAIDASAWPAALLATRELLGAANAALGLSDLLTFRTLLMVTQGVPDAFRDRLDDYTSEVGEIFGEIVLNPTRPLDEPFVFTRDTDVQRGLQNRYYREWVAPQGIVDVIGLVSIRQANRLASFSFGSRTPISDAQVVLLRLLAPHLRRAVTISDLIEARTIAATSFIAAVDRLLIGVVLVDGAAQIHHVNRAGEEQLVHGRGVKLVAGRLAAAEPGANLELQRAIAEAATNPVRLGATALGLPVSLPGETPILAYVLPLGGREASVAVFVQAADAIGAASEATVVKIYDLTPAEARVMMEIGGGKSPKNAAQDLGVSESTVRTQLSRVFQKTGTARQADLRDLLRSLSAPVRGPVWRSDEHGGDK